MSGCAHFKTVLFSESQSAEPDTGRFLPLTDKPRVSFVETQLSAADASSIATLYVHEGTALALQCAVDANPAAFAWSWSKESALLASASSDKLDVGELHRAAVDFYSCEATNDVGNDSASLRIVALCTHTLRLYATHLSLVA